MVITTECKQVGIMKNYLDVIQKSALFKDIEHCDIESMLGCLSAKLENYKKDEIIVMAGNKMPHIGIVVSGQVQVTKDDSMGNRIILSQLSPPDIYGEAICCANLPESPVTVISNEDSTILTMDFARILNICSNTCSFHTKLIENMMFILAQKNVFLQTRMDIISNKSVRKKVMLYLESFVPNKGSAFKIPLNREQMADYLCVDRSALSHELIKMKKAGIINYQRNTFEILH